MNEKCLFILLSFVFFCGADTHCDNGEQLLMLCRLWIDVTWINQLWFHDTYYNNNKTAKENWWEKQNNRIEWRKKKRRWNGKRKKISPWHVCILQVSVYSISMVSYRDRITERVAHTQLMVENNKYSFSRFCFFRFTFFFSSMFYAQLAQFFISRHLNRYDYIGFPRNTSCTWSFSHFSQSYSMLPSHQAFVDTLFLRFNTKWEFSTFFFLLQRRRTFDKWEKHVSSFDSICFKNGELNAKRFSRRFPPF